MLISGCAQSPLNTPEISGGFLAIPMRIHAEVKHDQFLILEGSKPFSFRIKVFPAYRTNGTLRAKRAYDEFAFSEKLPPGLYEIERYSFKSNSNIILTNAQNGMADLVGKNAVFKIEEDQITMMSKILQITGARHNDRSLKHWSGENISSGAFEDFTTFLKPDDVDRSYRVWRWLDFTDGEQERYNNMLSIEKTSDFWSRKITKESTLSKDYKRVYNVGSLILYSNGTIEDTDTGLMWAVKDNGFDLNWTTANKYCEGSSHGGYTDWRLPTGKELTNLHKKNAFVNVSKIGVIKTDNGVLLWTSDKRIAPLTKIFSGAGLVSTATGTLMFFHPTNEKLNRVIPVRNLN